MKHFYLLLLLAFTPYFLDAQEISGVVFDKSGSTLIGVHVHSQSTNANAITDLDGKFTIKANVNEPLLFTMVGMKKLTKAAQPSMKVIMEEEATNLKEMVVVGYGSKKMGSITGSVVQIKTDDIVKSPSQSAIQSIQGKAAGVDIVSNDEPGKNPSIRIRGLGTVLGGREPLFIVDGVETTSLNGLSSNEIEKIDILKDASSLAIYGQKGSNGVVVITTKKGKAGQINVNFDSYISVKTVQKKVKMADSYRYAYYNNSALGSANYFSFEQPYNTNWFEEITGTGHVINNYVSLSGSTERSNFYLGYTNFKEEGILNGSEYNRHNLNTRNEFKLYHGRVKISNSINLVSANTTPKPLSAFTNAYKQSPIVPVYFPNGSWGVPIVNSSTGLIDINGDDRFNNVGNPMAELYFYNQQSHLYNVFGSLGIEALITKKLKFNSNLGASYYYSKAYNYYATADIWLSQNPTSTLADYEATFGEKEVIYNSLERSRTDNFNHNWDNFFSYDLDLNQHQMNFVVGTSYSTKNNEEYLRAMRYNVPEQSNYWYLDLSSYNSALAPGTMVSNSHQTPIVSIAYFMRADYQYAEKYLLSASIRREGVSVFQESNRFGIFPAVSLGWIINREKFMTGIDFVNHLKLRAGFGEVGNSNTGNALNSVVFASGYNYAFGADQSIYPGSVVPYQVDPNLTWETMREFDFGLDYIIFDNKLSGSIEAYHRTSSNLILPVTLPSVLSPQPVYVNTGKVVNKGVEISIKWNKKLSDRLDYYLSFNGSYNHNELTEVDNSYFSNFIGGNLGNGQWTKQVLTGEALGSFYVYETQGYNSDGEFIYSSDRVVAGSYLPKFTGGFTFGANYRRFDFSTYIYGVAGNVVYNGKKAQRFGGENVEDALLDDFWMVSNTDAANPRPFNDVPLASTYYIEKGDYLRLNNITLGYSLPEFSKKIKKLRVYLTFQNVFTLAYFSGFTPELVGDNNSNPLGTAGIELDAYPTTRSFVFGLNLEI